MTVLNNLSETWLEITMLPFLTVLAAFLGGRMAISSEINRRFFMLIISTLASAFFEAILELFSDMRTVTVYTKIFYAIVNINAYCLMCYVAAYTRSISKKLSNINFMLLCISLFFLFVLNSHEKFYLIFSPGFAVLFVIEGFILQLIFQEYYGNGQFIVMNLLFLLLIDSFVLQYLFKQNLPLVYTVATIMLFFTFFYLEAPTYRRMIEAQKETEQARLKTEQSIIRTNNANKAKSNFLASTSHEIRTPMNAILGINDMILQELNKSSDYESRQASADIKHSGEYLLNLVNNILDISKIEAGKMDLYEASYHFWEVLKECELFVLDKIKDNNRVSFSLELDKTLPDNLFGDALRLKQLLTNLLDNAVKFTSNGKIILKVSGQRDHNNTVMLNFEISDTGIGMTPDDQIRIFEPFERANLVETRSILGAGLGLTLVKNIINIMDGLIEIHSEYGKGTIVNVKLRQKIYGNDKNTLAEYEAQKSLEVQEPQEITTTWPDAKILIVDDTPVNLVVAKGMLKDSEAQTETCESGEDALERMKKQHYDLVFLDHQMPGLDGIETLRRAKKYANGTKFIALTANVNPNARAEYVSFGFDDYLPKPFKKDEMHKLLVKYLGAMNTQSPQLT